MEENSLKVYGYTFQVKVLSAILSDIEFAGRIYEILKIKYFDSESLRWLSKCILNYFQEYRKLPTLEVFKSELVKVGEHEVALRAEIVSTLKDVLKNTTSEDFEYIKTEILSFCRKQEFKSALSDCIDILKTEQFDVGIINRVNDAFKKGSDFSVGHQYVDDIDERYNEEKLVHITTGWPVIDEITGGGLPKKKLGTITAALGAGKTFMAVSLGAAAIEAGYTVLHITLELEESEVGKRYDARLTGIGLDNLTLHLPEIKKKLNNYKGKLIIKEFLSGVTLFGIENYIDQCILMGIVPDVVIIDYDELIDIPKAWESFRQEQQLQMLLREARRKIAIGKNVALWIPCQATREGSDEDVVLMKHNANSYGKGREVDLGLTLSRKERDKVSNTARIHIGKSRVGPDGMTFPAHFDTSKSLIQIFREESREGKRTQEKMISQEQFMKDYAKNRYEQIMNTNRTEPEKTDLF